MTDEQIEKVKNDAADLGTIRPEFEMAGIDEEGEVCVAIKKTVTIRKK